MKNFFLMICCVVLCFVDDAYCEKRGYEEIQPVSSGAGGAASPASSTVPKDSNDSAANKTDEQKAADEEVAKSQKEKKAADEKVEKANPGEERAAAEKNQSKAQEKLDQSEMKQAEANQKKADSDAKQAKKEKTAADEEVATAEKKKQDSDEDVKRKQEAANKANDDAVSAQKEKQAAIGESGAGTTKKQQDAAAKAQKADEDKKKADEELADAKTKQKAADEELADAKTKQKTAKEKLSIAEKDQTEKNKASKKAKDKIQSAEMKKESAAFQKNKQEFASKNLDGKKSMLEKAGGFASSKFSALVKNIQSSGLLEKFYKLSIAGLASILSAKMLEQIMTSGMKNAKGCCSCCCSSQPKEVELNEVEVEVRLDSYMKNLESANSRIYDIYNNKLKIDCGLENWFENSGLEKNALEVLRGEETLPTVDGVLQSDQESGQKNEISKNIKITTAIFLRDVVKKKGKKMIPVIVTEEINLPKPATEFAKEYYFLGGDLAFVDEQLEILQKDLESLRNSAKKYVKKGLESKISATIKCLTEEIKSASEDAGTAEGDKSHSDFNDKKNKESKKSNGTTKKSDELPAMTKKQKKSDARAAKQLGTM